MGAAFQLEPRGRRGWRLNGRRLTFARPPDPLPSSWSRRLVGAVGVCLARPPHTRDLSCVHTFDFRRRKPACQCGPGLEVAIVVCPSVAVAGELAARVREAIAPSAGDATQANPARGTFAVRLSDEERAHVRAGAVAAIGEGPRSPVGEFARQALEQAARKALGEPSKRGRRRKSTSTPVPVVTAAPCHGTAGECSYQIEGAACTIAAPLLVPASGGRVGVEKVPARYCLVDVRHLHTSHRPLQGFSPDPEYPAGAQERDYQRTDEQAKVSEIAAHYEPALIFNSSPGAIDGVPVASENGIVLGGNGRTMATALVYDGRAGDKDAPRQFLADQAHVFGLTAEQVRAVERPMIVRTLRVGSDPRTLAEWSRRLNTSLSQQLDPTTLAVSRARFVSDAALQQLQVGDDETIAAFLASERSRPFVRALQTDGVIDARAASAFLASSGLLNERGRDLAIDLLVAVLVPDAQMISAYGRGPVASIARVAPLLVRLFSTPYDLRAQLGAAVRDRITMKAQGFERVGDYLRQGGLFSGAGAAVAGDERAAIVLRVLAELEAKPAQLLRWARRYVQLASAGASGQAALFAEESRTPLEALRDATREAGIPLESR